MNDKERLELQLDGALLLAQQYRSELLMLKYDYEKLKAEHASLVEIDIKSSTKIHELESQLNLESGWRKSMNEELDKSKQALNDLADSLNRRIEELKTECAGLHLKNGQLEHQRDMFQVAADNLAKENDLLKANNPDLKVVDVDAMADEIKRLKAMAQSKLSDFIDVYSEIDINFTVFDCDGTLRTIPKKGC